MIDKEKVRVFMLRMKEKEDGFYAENGGRIKELVSLCKASQGEYRYASHGSGSWATTYSDQFIDASLEIYMLLSTPGLFSPTIKLSELFIEAGILSCRGATMDIGKVEYLYEKHLKDKIARKQIR